MRNCSLCFQIFNIQCPGLTVTAFLVSIKTAMSFFLEPTVTGKKHLNIVLGVKIVRHNLYFSSSISFSAPSCGFGSNPHTLNLSRRPMAS